MKISDPNKSTTLDLLRLEQPLESVLEEVRDDRRDRENWSAIDARLDSAARRRMPSVRLTSLVLGDGPSVRRWFVMAGVACLVVGSIGVWQAMRPESKVVVVSKSDGVLRLLGGAPFEGVSLSYPPAPGDRDSVSLADGSVIRAIEPRTQLEPLALTEREVVLRLGEGAVAIDVAKGGRRKWTIEAGSLRVEVVGTRFDVYRRAERSRVVVTEGVVLVRSPQLPDGVQRVTAGQRVEVDGTRSFQAPSTANHSAPVSTSAANTPERSLSVTATELLKQSDAARLTGDLAAARKALETLLARFPTDPQAELAAYQLAVVKQKSGLPNTQVVAAFQQALKRIHSNSLRQDCYWRLVQLAELAGDALERTHWANASLREYPAGRYHRQLRRRLGESRAPQ